MEWAMVPSGKRLDLMTDEDEAKIIVGAVQKALDNAELLGLSTEETEKLTELAEKSERPMDY